MKRITLLLLTITTILLSSCNDSSRGVLQWAYQLAAEEESYNQSYLGHDDTNIYLERDWDIYRAYSRERSNGGYEIVYEKILESSADDPFPILVENGNIYMAYKNGSTFSFFYIPIPEEGQITSEAYSDAMTNTSNKCTLSGVSGEISKFGLSSVIARDESGKIYHQVVYKLAGEGLLDDSHYALIKSASNNTITLSSPVSVPTNSQIIGDGVLKATSDDPEINIPDNMNDLYLINGTSKLRIRTYHDSLDYPMGSDGHYAAMASGEICAIDLNEKPEGYDGRLHQSTLRFDVTDREGNYLITYKDGNSIIGYLSDNGLYWREDITDRNESTHKSQPDIISVSEDSDIMPLSFVGKHKTKANEYLLITQDNGFYILRPHASGVQRLEKIRSGSSYQLSDFFN